MDTISALIVALKRYSGAVLVVSHDRHFVRCVIQGAPILTPSADSDDDSDDDYYYGEGDDEGGGDDGGDDDAASRAPGEVYMVGPKGRVKLLSSGVDEYAESMEKRVRKLALG
jgi:ATPase subunit of ABC transporter with duplicated ATPase domains